MEAPEQRQAPEQAAQPQTALALFFLPAARVVRLLDRLAVAVLAVARALTSRPEKRARMARPVSLEGPAAAAPETEPTEAQAIRQTAERAAPIIQAQPEPGAPAEASEPRVERGQTDPAAAAGGHRLRATARLGAPAATEHL